MLLYLLPTLKVRNVSHEVYNTHKALKHLYQNSQRLIQKFQNPQPEERPLILRRVQGYTYLTNRIQEAFITLNLYSSQTLKPLFEAHHLWQTLTGDLLRQQSQTVSKDAPEVIHAQQPKSPEPSSAHTRV